MQILKVAKEASSTYMNDLLVLPFPSKGKFLLFLLRYNDLGITYTIVGLDHIC